MKIHIYLLLNREVNNVDIFRRKNISPSDLTEAYIESRLPVRQILGLPPKDTKAEYPDTFECEYSIRYTTIELKTVIKRSL